MNAIDELRNAQMKNPRYLPKFEVGDTVKVHFRIVEGDKERIQIFEGTVIARKGKEGPDAMFTVRRVAYNEGVERVFPLHSPRVERVEVTRKGRVRRAKLYYLRDRVGKRARVRDRMGARVTDDERGVAQKKAVEFDAKSAADAEAKAAEEAAAAEEKAE